MRVLERLQALRRTGTKGFGLLLDPDKIDRSRLKPLLEQLPQAGVDMILVGGSLVAAADIGSLIRFVKSYSALPVVLFPGHSMHLAAEADALLLLSLISGRNPDLLIGQHVHAAPVLEQLSLEVLPTGYMLIDGGRATSASYMSGTQPIPHDKADIAAYTALAGQYLGMRVIYADAGSGAQRPIGAPMIRAMAAKLQVPLIVGGGIRSAADAQACLAAGADMFVVGTALEGKEDIELLHELGAAKQAVAVAKPR